MEKTSKKLNLSPKTCTRLLKEAGIVLRPGRDPYCKAMNKQVHTAKFAHWLREHPNVRLPRSVRAIVELTDLTHSQIKCYLYRHRKRLKAAFTALTTLKDIPPTARWTDQLGVTIPVRAIEKLEFTAFDKFTFVGTLKATLKTGQIRIFKGPIESFVAEWHTEK